MRIITREQIEKVIDIPFLIAEIERGLRLYSKKETISSQTSFLRFESPPGDVHIKAGAVLGDKSYVVKIASGFWNNPNISLPSSHGLMLLFSQKTGELEAILLDEGRLTDLRTGLAGAIAAKHLACHPVDLIITATSSTVPLLFGDQLRPGVHITAVGADDGGKQELDASVFSRADFIVADSLSQCLEYGDLAHANSTGNKPVCELGCILENPLVRHDNWITVADLTGLAIEDLQIAKAVFSKLSDVV